MLRDFQGGLQDFFNAHLLLDKKHAWTIRQMGDTKVRFYFFFFF
jgi:hypothetical protein